jgi:hypothetical protein
VPQTAGDYALKAGHYAGWKPAPGSNYRGVPGTIIDGSPSVGATLINTAGVAGWRLEDMQIGPFPAGRGFHLGGVSNAAVVGCRIVGNNQGAQGGPIHDFLISRCEFDGNGPGSDIYIHQLYFGSGGPGDRSGIRIERTTFRNAGAGGDILFNSNKDANQMYEAPAIDRCRFYSDYEAINLYAARGAVVQNTLVYAPTRTGRLFDMADASNFGSLGNTCIDPMFMSCTIWAPNASSVFHQRGNATGCQIFNSIIVCVTPYKVDSGAFYIDSSSNLVIDVSGLSTLDALFVDWRAGDFRIKPGSMAHGTGRDQWLGYKAPMYDIDGLPRGGYDIGAFAAVSTAPPPPPPDTDWTEIELRIDGVPILSGNKVEAREKK